MEFDNLTFICSACKQVPEKNLNDKKGFEMVAYEDVMEWSNFSQDVPDLSIRNWERTSIPPIAGEMKKVQVHFPFNMSVGEKFWTLFRPALSSFNGWEEHPNEIDSSAIIKCSFESIISKNEERAWINIKIEEVIRLEMITDKFTQKDGEGYLGYFKFFGKPYMTEYNDWILFQASAQGDLGVWALVKKFKCKSIMVAYGEWEFHSDRVYCGNILLPENEINELIELSET
ncbi:hypothetical protein LQV63_24820 [Paenibacillus profundus]|uniref:Uncharacterized protein n=2 Tax=Paenibacillus TaxID=44249 RepID=A0ABS8YLR2_9BACL|nr:hypothetical protein [Paenibacillus profundus]MCE5172502.1 hypothetical protein [Paenibacillus profundus]MCM3337889.1 hypothetical protein [Paenibacillus sp. MER TA 81-3]